MKKTFDLEEALEQIKAGASIDGKDGVLAPPIKQLTEAALEAELESHLSWELRNRKYGRSSKCCEHSVLRIFFPRNAIPTTLSIP